MTHAIRCWVYGDDDLYLVYAILFTVWQWMIRTTGMMASKVYRTLLFPYHAVRHAVHGNDPSFLAEVTCGATAVLFGVMLWWQPRLFRLLYDSEWRWMWIVTSAGLGVTQFVAAMKWSRPARAQICAVTFSLWFAAFGWLASRAGLTLMHYMSGPLLFSLFLSIFILMRHDAHADQ